MIAMPDGPLTDTEWWSVDPKRWLADGRLELEAEHERWIGETKPGYPIKRYDLCRFIVRCRRDGTSKLLEQHYLKRNVENQDDL